MQLAQDFLDESLALERIIRGLSHDAFDMPTAFKSWSVNNILRHLHVWNYAADLSLLSGEAFRNWYGRAHDAVISCRLPEFEMQELGGLAGNALLDKWAAFLPLIAGHFSQVDPAQRVEWAGPGMSAQSSITARLMETWAHGQAVYDSLGIPRRNSDRIGSIALLGFKTYGWSFRNRGLDIPQPCPGVELAAPSGKTWQFGDDAGDEKISGLAEEFCQVVTQCRNIADTTLVVSGRNAKRWMELAQCFAGPPVSPPAPGSRHRASPVMASPGSSVILLVPLISAVGSVYAEEKAG